MMTDSHNTFQGVSGRMSLLVPAHPGSPGQMAVKRCVYVRVGVCV